MTSEPASFDILLRLSLVEGVTARHLPCLATAGSLFPGRDDQGGRTLIQRAAAAMDSPEIGERAARIVEACARDGIRIVPLGAPEYPEPLRQISDAPLVLYWRGAAAVGPEPVAVVGSRAPTEAGRAFARELAFDLSRAGCTIVSGMARGIDAAAHEGALRGTGQTVAVLGCGVDVLYPPEAGRLRDGILERGALVSEYPPGERPLPHRFPARNRIISGLAKTVVVAEAPERSGALITARFALDQGKDAMAVPGNPLFPHTAGSNRLLLEGAGPVTGAGDVLAALGWGRGGAVGGLRAGILALLTRERHVDAIAAALGTPVSELLPCLLDMELENLLERRPGDYYKKLTHGRG
jgi:DNA processing protein